MTAKDLIREGRLAEALAELQKAIRAQPGDAGLRVFLFQLCCLTGNLERAHTQLQVAAGFSEESEMLARVFLPLMECELLRRRVFAGATQPLVFGEPGVWVGSFLQAMVQHTQGNLEAAAKLREQAMSEFKPVAGSINGERFEWFADTDSRLGPMIEAMIFGKYYWVPVDRIRKITMEAPVDLRDLVWMPATLMLANGGQLAGHLPVRYPGSESSEDPAVVLARKTDYTQPLAGTYIGHGQRCWMTDKSDYALLETRTIEFDA